MEKVQKGWIEGYKKVSVPYTILRKTEDKNNLAIILPGAGYTVQAPLLHYSTSVLLKKDFDVLHVNYQYQSDDYQLFSYEEIVEAIKHDANTVISRVLNEISYENFYLIGKSIGTIALSSILEREVFKHADVVWLTPLLPRDDVFERMMTSHNKGLCVIGDSDKYYVHERYEQLKNNHSMRTILHKNANHSLEYDEDPAGSIELLRQVIQDIEQF